MSGMRPSTAPSGRAWSHHGAPASSPCLPHRRPPLPVRAGAPGVCPAPSEAAPGCSPCSPTAWSPTWRRSPGPASPPPGGIPRPPAPPPAAVVHRPVRGVGAVTAALGCCPGIAPGVAVGVALGVALGAAAGAALGRPWSSTGGAGGGPDQQQAPQPPPQPSDSGIGGVVPTVTGVPKEPGVLGSTPPSWVHSRCQRDGPACGVCPQPPGGAPPWGGHGGAVLVHRRLVRGIRLPPQARQVGLCLRPLPLQHGPGLFPWGHAPRQARKQGRFPAALRQVAQPHDGPRRPGVRQWLGSGSGPWRSVRPPRPRPVRSSCVLPCRVRMSQRKRRSKPMGSRQSRAAWASGDPRPAIIR